MIATRRKAHYVVFWFAMWRLTVSLETLPVVLAK
jgi:hypothetical protein